MGQKSQHIFNDSSGHGCSPPGRRFEFFRGSVNQHTRTGRFSDNTGSRCILCSTLEYREKTCLSGFFICRLQLAPSFWTNLSLIKISFTITYGCVLETGLAVGDNQASFLGSVQDFQTSLLFNLGTGGQLSCYSRHYLTCSELEIRPFFDKRTKNSRYLFGDGRQRYFAGIE